MEKIGIRFVRAPDLTPEIELMIPSPMFRGGILIQSWGTKGIVRLSESEALTLAQGIMDLLQDIDKGKREDQ